MIPSGMGVVSSKALTAAYQTFVLGQVPEAAFSNEVLEAVRRVSLSPEFVPWDLYLDMIEQAHAWCGSDERFIAACENFDRAAGEVRAFASPGVDVRRFCRLILETYDTAVYPDITLAVREVGEDTSELTVELPRTSRDGTSWFIANIGALRTMTRHLGLPLAQVTADIAPHVAKFTLRFPVTIAAADAVSEQTRHAAMIDLIQVLRDDVRLALRSKRPSLLGDDRLDRLTEDWALTARQRSVLECICRGMGNKEISTELTLSVKTVELHVTAILQKAGLSSRNQLVSVYAHR